MAPTPKSQKEKNKLETTKKINDNEK
jgi:hypothetical protein